MGYGNIKKFLSVCLLIAFTFPSTCAIANDYYASNPSSMVLNGNVNLTDKNDTITLSLRDSDVRQVLRMFADKAGMNIVFHTSVSGKVTLDLVQTPINDAFKLVLQIAGLNYYKQGNTMIIISKNSPDNAVYSKQEMLTFPINYVSADKIAEFLNKNVFSMKTTGMSGIDAATVNPLTNELIVFGMPSDVAIIQKVIEQFDREPQSVTFAVNHTTPAEMANMICNLLLPSRGISAGDKSKSSSSSSKSEDKSSASKEKGSETGRASDVSSGDSASEGSSSSGDDAMKLGEGIVACSANPTLSASVAPFNVQNLAVAYYPQRGTITLMGGSEAQVKMVEKFIKANDVKQPQAFLEVQIVELNEAGSKEFQNMWRFQSKNYSFTFLGNSTSGGRQGNWFGGKNNTLMRYYFDGPNYESGAPYQDTSGKWVVPNEIVQVYHALSPSAVHISWMMNYIISNNKGRVLANPKILITNGKESKIDLTQEYLDKVTEQFLSSNQNGQGSTGTVQRTYNKKDDLGIKIDLTPFISPEGYVTLNIKPEYSTIADKIYSVGETGNSNLVLTLLNKRNLDLKNVRIKDGETLIIGGMLQETENKSVYKIPFLGDLPLIGSIFRTTSTQKAKNELVIMITPNILNDGEGSVADNV